MRQREATRKLLLLVVFSFASFSLIFFHPFSSAVLPFRFIFHLRSVRSLFSILKNDLNFLSFIQCVMPFKVSHFLNRLKLMDRSLFGSRSLFGFSNGKTGGLKQSGKLWFGNVPRNREFIRNLFSQAAGNLFCYICSLWAVIIHLNEIAISSNIICS